MANETRTINGIVLREVQLKESDKIITVLSKELGVISIYAKGAMRLKNKFHSSTGLFTYSEFVLYEGKNDKIYRLNDGNVKKIFYHLSSSIENLSLAMYMAELVCEVSVPDEMSEDILRLFLNCLNMLSENKWSVLMTKSAFEMRLMSDIGFRPYLVGCKRCSAYENQLFFFDVHNGQLICPSCKTVYDADCIVCEPSVTLALRYLALADLAQMFSFMVSGISLVRLSQICERYILSHTKEEYKTLNFLKPLLQPLLEQEANKNNKGIES